jgi:cell division transport system ATP-binding protein
LPSRQEPSEDGVIRFENVGLRYGLGAEVLRDVTFGIEGRSFQFLTGPSGAGKTSLLRMMFLSLRPTGGRPCGAGSASSSRTSGCSTT